MSHLYSSGKSYSYIGRYGKIVREFLGTDLPLSRSGYGTYMKNNAMLVVDEPLSKDALCDFLDFLGIGYHRSSHKGKEVAALEKLSTVSDKNKRLTNDFIHHLTQDYDYSPHTLSIYAFGVKNYFEYANEISADNYRRYVKMLEEKGLTPQTIRLRMTSLEKLSEFAKKPVKFKRPKFARKLDTENVPTEDEYNKLLAFLNTQKNRDRYFFIKILATTGARVSEFLQFTWEDVMAGEVTLRGKGNKYRRFFFSRQLQDEVKIYLQQTGKSGYIATGKYGRITSRGLNQGMKDWGAKCGIERVKMHPHAFRHFFAKMYLKKNKDVIQLAELLGHGSVDTTRIYLQKSYDEQKRDFNRNVTW